MVDNFKIQPRPLGNLPKKSFVTLLLVCVFLTSTHEGLTIILFTTGLIDDYSNGIELLAMLVFIVVMIGQTLSWSYPVHL